MDEAAVRSVQGGTLNRQRSALLDSAWWWIWLALVVATPGETKLAGAGWAIVAVFGLIALFRQQGQAFLVSPDDTLARAGRTWFFFCLAGFAFKAIGVSYWGDAWKTRHFDMRMILSALAVAVLVSRLHISTLRKHQLATALSMASVVAFIVAYLHANLEFETPSNRINWAGGLAMLSWVLLSVAADGQFSRLVRYFAGIGFALLWGGILMTGARSAYLSLPWALLAGALVMFMTVRHDTFWRRVAVLGFGLILSMAVLHSAVPSIFSVPAERIQEAVSQAESALAPPGDPRRDVDTPVGSRIYMWQRSWEVFKESPWIGYGRLQRIAFIKEWGKESNAHIISDQFHLHSEYVNGMVDHGLVGLASTLSYMIGLVVLAWSLRKTMPLTAMAFGGIAFTHITMSITNANSQTNNYSVVFSLAMVTLFLLRPGRPRNHTSSA